MSDPNRPISKEELIEIFKVIEIFKDEDDYNTQTNPAYYCDGGCGKKVGEGYEHDCKRVCDECEEPPYKYSVIKQYSHDDKDREFETLCEAKKYCDDFNLNLEKS